MIMKNLLLASLLLIGTIGVNHSAFAAKSDPVKKTELSVTDVERAKVLNDRLTEINEMDKSDLSFVERRELRKEVRAIKGELAELGGGVYLSVGAIIIVLLLLILLL